jgi:glycosyltransferase involved in cell wall biosynthesis
MELPKNKALSPTFSIVTVVFNGEQWLEQTILSVKNQTYPYIEYIIVDGKSTDGSMDIVKKYAALMPNLKYISEKDQGIYDAMNKGQKMATCDFIWYMNAGDEIYSPETVENLIKKITPATDVIFGETMLIDENRQPIGTMSELSTRKLPKKAFRYTEYLKGMLVVHQSFLARRTHCNPFIVDNLCADFDWCIELVKSARDMAPANQILSKYLTGGVSKQRHNRSLRDRYWVMQRHFGHIRTIITHVRIVFRSIWHRITNIGKAVY